MRPVVRVLFGVLIAWVLTTAVVNVVLGRWDWVAFDIACMAVVLGSWALSERALKSMHGMDVERDSTIAHYKVMLEDMRRAGNEPGEQYALTMLAIWDKRPVPLAPDDLGDGGLSPG